MKKKAAPKKVHKVTKKKAIHKKVVKKRPIAKKSAVQRKARDSAREFFDFLDKDGNDEIQWEEFRRAWKRNIIPVY